MSRHISFPKSENPIRNGIRRLGSARAYFDFLKGHVSRVGSLTAIEWDWYRARQREWEPEAYAAEMAAAERRINIDHARRLSLADLEIIVIEKVNALSSQQQD